MFMDVVKPIPSVMVLPEPPPVMALMVVLVTASDGNAVRSDFNTVSEVTLGSTAYVILADFSEYVMLPDSVGALYGAINVCAIDGKLSRPVSLPRATTTNFTVVENTMVIAAVLFVVFTEVVTPVVITVLSDSFRTCTAVTPAATVYVMLAVMLGVLPEYEMFPTNTGCANLTPNGLVCTVRPEPVLKLVGGFGVTFATFHPLMFWLNALALLNMKFMSVTAPVFHVPMGWLNAE
jgi:hypothetical protein